VEAAAARCSGIVCDAETYTVHGLLGQAMNGVRTVDFTPGGTFTQTDLSPRIYKPFGQLRCGGIGPRARAS
jgi:hypothetical protein